MLAEIRCPNCGDFNGIVPDTQKGGCGGRKCGRCGTRFVIIAGTPDCKSCNSQVECLSLPRVECNFVIG